MYHANEGLAHVSIDGERYRVRRKMWPRGGSILPTRSKIFYPVGPGNTFFLLYECPRFSSSTGPIYV